MFESNIYNFMNIPMGHWRRDDREPLPRRNVNTYSLRTRQSIFQEDPSLKPKLNLDFSGQMEDEEMK